MSVPVEIRKYQGEAAFKQDAAIMAASGWYPVTQSSGGAMSSGGQWCAALGIILAIVGVVAAFPLILVGVVLVIIGAFLRDTTYTVTYRPDVKMPPAP